MVVLSEQGLYFFLGRSDKEKALPFQKWIAGDVLPSIRKTGTYSIDGYRKKSTSAGEVVNLVKTTSAIMRNQGSNDHKIARQVERHYKQFGIDIIPDFIEPEPPYTQIQLAEMGYYQGRR